MVKDGVWGKCDVCNYDVWIWIAPNEIGSEQISVISKRTASHPAASTYIVVVLQDWMPLLPMSCWFI